MINWSTANNTLTMPKIKAKRLRQSCDASSMVGAWRATSGATTPVASAKCFNQRRCDVAGLSLGVLLSFLGGIGLLIGMYFSLNHVNASLLKSFDAKKQ